ncbi:MAG: pantoate--beta-alanine ligase [Fimbriimonas sp.]
MDSSKTIGFVPTMGALHQGHLDLMRRSREENDLTVVSVFVNPLQFGPREDFSRYPRNLAGDASLAESVGVDIVFAPTADTMTRESTTQVVVGGVTELWEGERRPGHFAGVATIVAKLFNIVRPARAYFGWKDLQQCLVIRRMVRDLNILVDLKFIETTREPDGLAMSSRNAYLSPELRQKAPALFRNLEMLREVCENRPNEFENALELAQNALVAEGFRSDYLEWVSLETLAITRRADEPSALIAACYLGDTRLIDNIRLRNDS